MTENNQAEHDTPTTSAHVTTACTTAPARLSEPAGPQASTITPYVGDGEPTEGNPKKRARLVSELGLSFETECILRGTVPPFCHQSHCESL